MFRMAGMYIHIPFCKQACNYCNFHFSTSLKYKDDIVKAILREIDNRKDYLEDKKIRSIYFGGGTPSLLSKDELNMIIASISKTYDLSDLQEVTLEANPDDLSPEKLKEIHGTIINRLSIGIQSFHQDDLDFMTRAHTAEEGIRSIKEAQEIGFENITIDLIYGVPTSSSAKWEENLEHFFELAIPHLSSYALTVEDRTAYAHQIKKGKVSAPDEDDLAEQYDLLQKYVRENQFEHYELSNYAKSGFHAVHNSSYWEGESYLGIGPSAHSFNGTSRQWNVANNSLYLRSDFAKDDFFQREELSERDRYHDALISQLRTKKGISLGLIEKEFSQKVRDHFFRSAENLKEYLKMEKASYAIKEEYWLTSDDIVRKLMLNH